MVFVSNGTLAPFFLFQIYVPFPKQGQSNLWDLVRLSPAFSLTKSSVEDLNLRCLSFFFSFYSPQPKVDSEPRVREPNLQFSLCAHLFTSVGNDAHSISLVVLSRLAYIPHFLTKPLSSPAGTTFPPRKIHFSMSLPPPRRMNQHAVDHHDLLFF